MGGSSSTEIAGTQAVGKSNIIMAGAFDPSPSAYDRFPAAPVDPGVEPGDGPEDEEDEDEDDDDDDDDDDDTDDDN